MFSYREGIYSPLNSPHKMTCPLHERFLLAAQLRACNAEYPLSISYVRNQKTKR